MAITRRRWGARLLALLVTLLMLAGCSRSGGGNTGKPPVNTHVLIAELFPGGPGAGGADQYIRLHNPTAQPVDLTGWSLGDAKVRAVFPAGASIGANQSLYVARDAEGFRKLMGAPSEHAWGPGGTMTGAPGYLVGAAEGVAVLRDASGQNVDVLVYGTQPAASVTGWRGAPVPAPQVGEAIDRARDEASWNAQGPGAYTRDTDTAADWKQGSQWVDGRVFRPGQSWFGYPTYTATRVTAFASPDGTYANWVRLIDQARESIDLNMYDFTQVPIAQKLAAAAKRGVTVRLLLEAGSVNGLYDQERYIAKVVAEAGGQVRWILNDPGQGYPGRYVYNHAKYMVVDGRVSIVQSENMVRHGTPQDPTFGNRGWGALVEEEGLAAFLSRVFAADWSPVHGDIAEYRPGTPFGPPEAGFVPDTKVQSGNYQHPFQDLTVRGDVPVTVVLSPEHTLLETKGIIGLMRGAKESLLIEQQYAHVYCPVCPRPPVERVNFADSVKGFWNDRKNVDVVGV